MELFAGEGETVNVGGNLFKIDTDANAPTPVALESKPATASKPVAAESDKPIRKRYVSLIKFLGPRSKVIKEPKKEIQEPKEETKVSVKAGVQVVHYESVEQLPNRF